MNCGSRCTGHVHSSIVANHALNRLRHGVEVCHSESRRADFVANLRHVRLVLAVAPRDIAHGATTWNPAFADSTNAGSPKPLAEALRIAIFISGLEMVNPKQAENWNPDVEKWENTRVSSRLPRFGKGVSCWPHGIAFRATRTSSSILCTRFSRCWGLYCCLQCLFGSW